MAHWKSHGDRGGIFKPTGRDAHQFFRSVRSRNRPGVRKRGLDARFHPPGVTAGHSAVSGFTLTELVIVIVILGILSAVAIPVIGTFISSSKETATKDELRMLARAIAGSDENGDRGFEGDVGYPPSALGDLVAKPDTIPAWDPFLDVGWNGPYVDSSDNDYLYDAWDSTYVYDPASRSLTSNGSGTGITITF